ncbi:MAG: dihydrofolate reductase [Legionellales bacterium]|nr:dihydrofolate reductase [Legionellales bacterium]|tara:strand:- start:1503 stop:2015 length:513 start_codon:yes stop_codon:yes gene_type:complete
MTVKQTIIVAKSSQSVIGHQGKIPWHMPGDLTYFKQVTMGKPMIMGHKTWLSLGKPLPGRQHIVLSRQCHHHDHPDVTFVSSYQAAIDLVNSFEEVMIIGGQQVYQLALEQASRLHLTEIHGDFPGDTYFPHWQEKEWKLTSKTRVEKDASNPCDRTHFLYQRIESTSHE